MTYTKTVKRILIATLMALIFSFGFGCSDLNNPYPDSPPTPSPSAITVNVPTINGGSEYAYTGSTITLELNGFDSATMNISNNTGIEPNNYTAIVTLKDTANYKWNDGTTTAKTFNWSIVQASVAVPLAPATTSYVYDGGVKTYALSGVNDNLMNVEGTTEATTAGTYTVSVSLKNSSMTWADGTNEVKTFTWNITPKPVNVPTASTSRITWTGNPITYVPDGYDSSTMNISNNTGIDPTTYNATVTLKDTTNYKWNDDSTGEKDFTFKIVKDIAKYAGFTPKQATSQTTGYFKGSSDVNVNWCAWAQGYLFPWKTVKADHPVYVEFDFIRLSNQGLASFNVFGWRPVGSTHATSDYTNGKERIWIDGNNLDFTEFSKFDGTTLDNSNISVTLKNGTTTSPTSSNATVPFTLNPFTRYRFEFRPNGTLVIYSTKAYSNYSDYSLAVWQKEVTIVNATTDANVSTPSASASLEYAFGINYWGAEFSIDNLYIHQPGTHTTLCDLTFESSRNNWSATSYSTTTYNMSNLKVYSEPGANSGEVSIENLNNPIPATKTATAVRGGSVPADFTVTVEGGRDIRILQVTDVQVIDAGQCRYDNRLNSTQLSGWATNTVEQEAYRMVRQMIERTRPDIIILTGDNTYGEFDDSGEAFMDFYRFIDSFGIYWGSIWGNHDNESNLGVNWQVSYLDDMDYCLFNRGSVTGNSNYSIAIMQNNELKQILYMMDSNGTGNTSDPNVTRTSGYSSDQISWYDNTHAKITNYNGGTVVPSLLFTHITWHIFMDVANVKGNLSTGYTLPDSSYTSENPEFGTWKRPANIGTIDTDYAMWGRALKNNIQGVFVGHEHQNNTSFVHKGVRLTYGLKASEYDAHNTGEIGATLITVKSDKKIDVDHIYFSYIDGSTYSQGSDVTISKMTSNVNVNYYYKLVGEGSSFIDEDWNLIGKYNSTLNLSSVGTYYVGFGVNEASIDYNQIISFKSVTASEYKLLISGDCTNTQFLSNFTCYEPDINSIAMARLIDSNGNVIPCFEYRNNQAVNYYTTGRQFKINNALFTSEIINTPNMCIKFDVYIDDNYPQHAESYDIFVRVISGGTIYYPNEGQQRLSTNQWTTISIPLATYMSAFGTNTADDFSIGTAGQSSTYFKNIRFEVA